MTQPTLHLHHYPISPFAEKVRLMLGFKGLAWHSVMQPSIMPKPDLQALTGGYRRIPVLQIGADIVCDTALIADVLEHLAPAPTLYPPGQKALARTVAQWADSALFVAGMAYNFQPAGAAMVFKDASPEVGKAFAEDRKAMRGGAPRMAPGDGTAAYCSYLRRLASMLEPESGVHHDFLLGNQASIADFAAYHTLWFTQKQTPPLAAIFDKTPAIKAWMARVAAFGHGQIHPSDASKAIAATSMDTKAGGLFGFQNTEAEPFIDDHGIALGTSVAITAESFGPEPSEGQLIASTRTRLSIQRQTPSGQTVRVHFPKIGFSLKALG